MTKHISIKVSKIEVTKAQEYGQYFKCILENGKIWNIVAESHSIEEQEKSSIIKIFPFKALPIILEVESKKNILYLTRNKKCKTEK